MKTRSFNFISLFFHSIIFLLITSKTSAQYNPVFRHEYSNNVARGIKLIKSHEGNYFISGIDNIGTNTKIYLLKTNSYGGSLWMMHYGGNFMNQMRDFIQTSDGGFLIAGSIGVNPSPNQYAYIIKTDPQGDSLWTKSMGSAPANGPEALSIIENDDSTIVVLTNEIGTNINKLNKNGGVIWQQSIAPITSNVRLARKTIKSMDGNYLLGGVQAEIGTLNSEQLLLAKCDTSSVTLWAQSYFRYDSSGYKSREHLASLIETRDSGVVALVNSFSPSGLYHRLYIIKTNSTGDTLWTSTIGDSISTFNKSPFTGNSIIETEDHGFIVAGARTISGVDTICLLKLDSVGHLSWFNYFESYYGQATSILENNDGGYSFTGYNDQNTILIRCNKVTNHILGKVYADVNQNCIFDSTDYGLKGLFIRAEPGPYSGVTDENGNYEIFADTGSYNVNINSSHPLWDIRCQNSPYSISFSTSGDSSLSNDFGIKSSSLCPRLKVAISCNNRLRSCQVVRYNIEYTNEGTTLQTNTSVEIELNSLLSIQYSSIPISNQQGNSYTFQTGDLNPNQSGSFYIECLVNCTAPSHSSVCVHARILPDINCGPSDTAFDRRQLQIIGTCVQNDSIQFNIANRNILNDTLSGLYYIYENNILSLIDTFRLKAGDSLLITYPAFGKAIMIQTFYVNFPNVTLYEGPLLEIEGCGSPAVYGQVGQLYLNNQFFNFSESCKEVFNSTDPNEKTVSPLGLGVQHFISASGSLEYQIDFQNFGNDTAYYVMVRDTISPLLDPSTIEMLGSSHSYIFNIFGNEIAEWVFPNILLPDSGVNSEGSKGYVRFRINQKPGNNSGDQIDNSAAVYFDFNDPVITNKTTNTICQPPASAFSTSISGGQVTFTNLSTNSSRFYWRFGDGLSDTTSNPIHAYQQNGIYNVCLVSASECGSEISCNQVSILSVSASDELNKNRFEITPNPFEDAINISSKNVGSLKYSIRIFDALGKSVYFKNETVQNLEINTTQFPKGIYLVRIETEGEEMSRVLIK